MKPAIRFDHVSKRYQMRHERARSFQDLFVRGGLLRRRAARAAQTLWALRDVSFDIGQGETVGLVGPNGAGKSTALKLVSRVIAPTAGRLEVEGRVAALLELGTGFHPELSGRDNIFLSGALIGMGRPEMLAKYPLILEFSELAPFIHMPVKHYSSGMFARLAFAVSIHLEPEVLLVDEVLAVGDQSFQRKCLDRIGDLQRAGVTVVMVSHALETVRSLCQRVLWFDHGQVVADGTADAVVRQYLARVTEEEAERLARGAAGPERHAAPGEGALRWGTGDLAITAVRLLNSQGQPQHVFATGDLLAIEIEYDADRPVESPVFGVGITRHDGLHITGPNTGFAGLTLPTVHGPGRVSYTIPRLPLLEGLFHVSVAATDADDTHTYDYHDRLYPFRITNPDDGPRERYGLMTLGGQWQHLPEAASVRLPAASAPEGPA